MDLSDAEVMARAAGEPEYFVHVFDRHGAAVHAFLARRIGRHAADDLLAEVWVQALRSVERYDARGPDARPWLYGIARNMLRTHWRARSRSEMPLGRTDPLDLDPWGDVDAQLDAARRSPALRVALAALPVEDREVLLLVAWEELTPGEVAVALGVPAGTVRWRLHRARASLRRQLDDAARAANSIDNTMGV